VVQQYRWVPYVIFAVFCVIAGVEISARAGRHPL